MYPPQIPTDNSVAKVEEDSSPNVGLIVAYKYPNKLGAKFPTAPVRVNIPWAVPPMAGPTVDCKTLTVGPNQHSATKYSSANHVMAVEKDPSECTDKYHAGAARSDPTTGTHNLLPTSLLLDDEDILSAMYPPNNPLALLN